MGVRALQSELKLLAAERDSLREERDRLERALRHSQQLETLGELSSGVAHEMNTPIQYIGDNLQFVESQFNKILEILDSFSRTEKSFQNELKKIDFEYLRREIPLALSQSLEGVQHVSSIIKSMKDFAHPGHDHQVQADLNRSVESVTLLSKNEWKSHCDLIFQLDANLPKIWCFPGLVNQALFNLLSNSLDAIRSRIAKKEIKRGEITLKTRVLGDRVELTFSDNGGGIPHKFLTQIFQPFFTTKAPGEGTGQGLALVKTLIEEKHQGKVEVDNLNEGAQFRFLLPIEGLQKKDVA
jgi:signal transduction histidine kinase